jgi:hypothetical protein
MESIFPTVRIIWKAFAEPALGRWNKSAEYELKGERYRAKVQYLKDIYPLIGGKHQKMWILCQALDATGQIREQTFSWDDNHTRSKAVMEAELFPRASFWVEATCGETPKFHGV